jgi:hypothetical protein
VSGYHTTPAPDFRRGVPLDGVVSSLWVRRCVFAGFPAGPAYALWARILLKYTNDSEAAKHFDADVYRNAVGFVGLGANREQSIFPIREEIPAIFLTILRM